MKRKIKLLFTIAQQTPISRTMKQHFPLAHFLFRNCFSIPADIKTNAVYSLEKSFSPYLKKF